MTDETIRAGRDGMADDANRLAGYALAEMTAALDRYAVGADLDELRCAGEFLSLAELAIDAASRWRPEPTPEPEPPAVEPRPMSLLGDDTPAEQWGTIG